MSNILTLLEELGYHIDSRIVIADVTCAHNIHDNIEWHTIESRLIQLDEPYSQSE